MQFTEQTPVAVPTDAVRKSSLLTVPANAVRIRLVMLGDSSLWSDPGVVFWAAVYRTTDGGTTFRFAAGLTFQGAVGITQPPSMDVPVVTTSMDTEQIRLVLANIGAAVTIGFRLEAYATANAAGLAAIRQDYTNSRTIGGRAKTLYDPGT